MRSMTRKDFELIARVLRFERQNHEGQPSQQQAIANVVIAFANELATTNPRFDRERFIAAASQD